MFRAILWGQWKWSRIAVIGGAVAGMLLPLLSVRIGSPGEGNATSAQELLRQVKSWGSAYPIFAAGLGLLIAMSAWAPDHRGKHIHALTLPITRARYVLLRYAAGWCLLVPAMLALLTGALIVQATMTLPPGFQTYPFALALRFALATGVAFSIFFAIAGGTSRTAGLVLIGIALVVAGVAIALQSGVQLDAITSLLNSLFGAHGLFGVFGGRWMLVDV
jgi:hypothetical protein